MKKVFVFTGLILVLFAQGAKKGRPIWIDKPEAVYSRASYLSAVGEASSRQQADANALGNLISLFGQRVENKIVAVETLREEINKNKDDFFMDRDTTQAVELSSTVDGLIGAEIKDRWEDSKTKTFYAVAVIERLEAIRIYNELIAANHRAIERNLNIAASDKTSFEGIIRYRAAARIADANELFAIILTVLGGPDHHDEFGAAASYRAEALRLAKQIPVRVVVENDVHDRVFIAFAEVFSGAGFISGQKNVETLPPARYELKAALKISPAGSSDSNLVFTRYSLDAKLLDTKNGTILVPFAASGREGHLTQTDADQIALRSAARIVYEDFAGRFAAYCEGE